MAKRCRARRRRRWRPRSPRCSRPRWWWYPPAARNAACCPSCAISPKPSTVAVEADRLRDRGHLQVHVAHDRPRAAARRRAPSPGSLELAEQALDVERQRRHPRADLPLPDLPRPVPVDLDPVRVGIAQVERLADEVVGEPDERHAVARRVREPAREVGALGHEQREVVEAGVADRRPRTGLLDEHQQLAPARAERRAAVSLLEQLEPDRRPVVLERALELRDGQVNRAERGLRRDLAARGRTRRPRAPRGRAAPAGGRSWPQSRRAGL